MQIAVRHNMEIFAVTEGEPCEADRVALPIADAQAVMGETVEAYLARVAWRFDLPTVCRINGEFYGRDEWATRALAVNDNVEFVSRPLGSGGSGGSATKSIVSIVAMLALTAVAGPAGGLVSAALGGGFTGAVTGALASAVIVGAAAAPVALWMAPQLPRWRVLLSAARDSLRGIVAVAGRFWSLAR